MIGFLRGRLRAKEADRVLVDVAGVGYRVQIPFSTFFALGDVGSNTELFIHTHVREDALALFGFATELEQLLFEKLISVTGIGPRLAVTILSGMAAPDLSAAIRGSEVRRLTSIPGLGKKTADRLILELKDKLDDVGGATRPPIRPNAPGTDRDDAVSALVNLGYRQRDAEAAVERVPSTQSSLEQILKAALTALAR